MKNIQNFLDFNESVKTDSIKTSLENVFKVLSNPKKGDSSFEVDVVYNELDTEIECYVDIVSNSDEFTSEEKDKIYNLIEDADKYIKSVNGKLTHMILSNLDTGNEVTKSSISAAKEYKKSITSIRVWFDIKKEK
jgi:hypothetical protein